MREEQARLEGRLIPPREFAREPRKTPTPDDAGGGRLSSYARWDIGKYTYAWMILLSYLEQSESRDERLSELLRPRDEGESEQEAADRRRTAELLVETSAMAGTPADQVAEIMSSWVALSIVPELVGHLADEGLKLLESATAAPDPDAWEAGARSLFAGVCPAWHWNAGLDQVDRLAHSRLVVNGPVRTAMTEHPAATIHAMAALVAWLYGQPDVVPNRAESVLELAERASKFGKFIF